MAQTSTKVRNNIPNDLAFVILSKLPVKSLKRFACVRKSWSNLFENPQFMSLYRNNFISKYDSDNANSCLLLKQYSRLSGERDTLFLLSGERFENRVKLDWPPPLIQDDYKSIIVLGSTSVNGVLCLYQGMFVAPAAEIDLKIVLWNPSSQEINVIPSGHIECPRGFDIFVQLHGFGYDHVTDDYKIIRYSEFYEQPDYFEDWEARPSYPMPLWQIYSQRSNYWKKLDNTNLATRNLFPSRTAVYLNGMCHWCATILSIVHSNQNVLVSFNMSNELVLETPLPLDGQDIFPWRNAYLLELNGSIALITHLPKTNTTNISILGELGVKESWIKLFTIRSLPSNHIPIGVGTKCGIFFGKCCEDDDELTWFNLSTQVIEEIGVKATGSFCQIVSYKEILLPMEAVNM